MSTETTRQDDTSGGRTATGQAETGAEGGSATGFPTGKPHGAFSLAPHLTLIASFNTPAGPGVRAGRVILIKRDTEFEPYVTGWQGEGDKGWCSGHYFTDFEEAREDFFARCRREF